MLDTKNMMPPGNKSATIIPFSKKRGSMDMKGGIYKNKGYGAKYILRFKGVFRRLASYEDAENMLIALNYKEKEGEFDPRDYQKDKPLGFENLAEKWLDHRQVEGVRYVRCLRYHMDKAIQYFGNRNIKIITSGEWEDFFLFLRKTTELSDKSLYNIRTTIHAFYTWACNREKNIEFPQLPVIHFRSKRRRTISKETQFAVLEEIKRLSWDINPKIYIGCLWLATYVELRPLELIHIKEGDINIDHGIIHVAHNYKETRDNKIIYLLPEDVELIRSFPSALPHLYFFRHGKRMGVHKSNRDRFGKDYLYKWWRKACRQLGVQGVPLYPGTRHSSIEALGEYYSPEEIMDDGTGHATVKAFRRYFQVKADRKRSISAHARSAQDLKRDAGQANEGN